MKRAVFLAVGILLLAAGLAYAADEIQVKPFITIFTDYMYNFSGYPEKYDPRSSMNDFNAFELQRAYLGLNAQLSPAWSANVTIDAGRADVTKFDKVTIKVPSGVADNPSTPDVDESLKDQDVLTGSTTAKTGQYAYYVKYAYMTYQPKEYAGGSFGMITTPYAWKVYSLWRHRYLLDSAFTNYKFIRSSTADLGASIQGVCPGNYGSYNVAVLNGEGYKAAEANKGKAVGLMVFLSPFQKIDALKGLTLMGTYHFDNEIPVFKSQPALAASSWDAILSYKLDFDRESTMGFSVNGEYASRNVSTGSLVKQPVIAGYTKATLNSTVLSVWADFWFATHYGVLVRYDSLDPNTRNNKKDYNANPAAVTYEGLTTNAGGYQDEQTFLLAGFWVQPVKPIRLCLNYRQIAYTAKIPNDKGKQVTMVPDKFMYLNGEVKF